MNAVHANSHHQPRSSSPSVTSKCRSTATATAAGSRPNQKVVSRAETVIRRRARGPCETSSMPNSPTGAGRSSPLESTSTATARAVSRGTVGSTSTLPPSAPVTIALSDAPFCQRCCHGSVTITPRTLRSSIVAERVVARPRRTCRVPWPERVTSRPHQPSA